MVTFLGEPNQLVKLNPPIGTIKYVRFDDKGEYTTENVRVIERFHHHFDSVPAGGKEPTPELTDDLEEMFVTQEENKAKKWSCNQCESVFDTKGLLLAHKKSEHPKGD